MKQTNVIGIDPGLHTGVAIYSRTEKRITFHKTLDFWAVFDSFKDADPKDYLIVIETPKKGFAYPQRQGGNSRQVREMIAFKSGENNREATLLIKKFEELGFEVRTVTPTKKKWSATDLRMYTKIADRTSEHVRDAISMCYGV